MRRAEIQAEIHEEMRATRFMERCEGEIHGNAMEGKCRVSGGGWAGGWLVSGATDVWEAWSVGDGASDINRADCGA